MGVSNTIGDGSILTVPFSLARSPAPLVIETSKEKVNCLDLPLYLELEVGFSINFSLARRI